MKKAVIAIFLSVLFFSFQVATARAELVTNGGFESGDFSGWTLSNVSFTSVTLISTSYPVHSGSYSARLGSVYSDGYLSQNIATVAGEQYTVSFWLASTGNIGNHFSVSLGGTTLFDQMNIPGQDYTEYSYTVTADSNNALLTLASRDDVNFLRLDDVSVVSANASSVPEPGAVWFLGSGLISLIGLRRRFTK